MERLHIETLDPGRPLRVAAADLPAEGCAVKFYYRVGAEGPPREVVLCRRDGKLFALDSLCPHQGGRLSDGPLIDGRHLHCPLHLYKFRPEDGVSVGADCEPATTFAVRVEDGDVLVEVRGGAT